MKEKVLTWDAYFMTLAEISSFRSKDPVTVVGACIVNDKKRVIGLGYNGMPRGNDVNFSWEKSEVQRFNKYNYVVHAEINAILNTTTTIENAYLYTTLFPCSNCAKIIAQTGIREVIFLRNDPGREEDSQISQYIFDSIGIKVRQLPNVPLIDHIRDFNI